MQKSVQITLAVVAVNAILIVLCVAGSYLLANTFNTTYLLKVNWNPFLSEGIIQPYIPMNGNYVPTAGLVAFCNFPYWLFFVSTAANLCFIVLLLRQKETTKQG